MTPEDARGYTDGLSFGSKQDVWGEFPNRYDHWDAFEAFATIAGLRYEYAVQVFEEGWWRTLGLRGTYKQAVALANLWRGDTCRVARRLATDWEVAE